MTNDIRAFLREAGKKGGATTRSKYTKEDFQRWGKKGGRPRTKPSKTVRKLAA